MMIGGGRVNNLVSISLNFFLEIPSSLSSLCLNVRKLSLPKTYPKPNQSITFDFNPTPVDPPIAKYTVKPTTPAKPLPNQRAMRRTKKQKMNYTWKEKYVYRFSSWPT